MVMWRCQDYLHVFAVSDENLKLTYQLIQSHTDSKKEMSEPDFSDPYANWQRLQATYTFLKSVAEGKASADVHPNYYSEQIRHIKQYLLVLYGTHDCDHSAIPYFEELTEQYATRGYFDLAIYFIAVSRLIGAKDDYDLMKDFESMLSFA